jgi:hypothetical protein
MGAYSRLIGLLECLNFRVSLPTTSLSGVGLSPVVSGVD